MFEGIRDSFSEGDTQHFLLVFLLITTIPIATASMSDNRKLKDSIRDGSPCPEFMLQIIICVQVEDDTVARPQ